MTHPHIDDVGLSLASAMQIWPETVPVFLRHRMHCVGCPVGRFYSVADACKVYGLPPDTFLAELREAIIQAAKPR